MVGDAAEYPWSSYRANGLGVETDLCTPHTEYLLLGGDQQERTAAYRALFKAHVDGKLIEEIRKAANKGLALGSESFKDEVEALYGRRVRPARMGRPAKLDLKV